MKYLRIHKTSKKKETPFKEVMLPLVEQYLAYYINNVHWINVVIRWIISFVVYKRESSNMLFRGKI